MIRNSYIATCILIDLNIVQDFADEHEMPLLETSGKDGTNVEQTFITLAAMIRTKQIELSRHITLGGPTRPH